MKSENNDMPVATPLLRGEKTEVNVKKQKLLTCFLLKIRVLRETALKLNKLMAFLQFLLIWVNMVKQKSLKILIWIYLFY